MQAHVIRILAALFLAACQSAAAQQFPAKPVRLIVPYGAGGPTDIVARVLANGLSEAWGQQMLVENRPGAAGHIGSDAVVRSAPDGYTLLLVPAGPVVINRWLFEKMPFDPQKDLAPVSQLAAGTTIMFVSPQLPVKTLAEFVRYAKDNPGRINFSSTGTGTMPHLAGEILKRQAGLEMQHVPYKGSPQALAAVMSGDVAAMFETPSALPHARAGKLRALAVVGRSRYSGAPEIPTAIEAGVPGFSVSTWYGLLAPAQTPRDLVRKIQADAARVLLAADAKAKLSAIGFDVVASTPEAFTETIAAESAQWEKLIKAAGIRAE